MNKYFTVNLMYGMDRSDVLNNVEKIETTDIGKIIIRHWIFAGNIGWYRTMELIDPKSVNIIIDFNLHELER